MKEIESYISPKHVYTILNTDRCGIRTSIIKAFKINKNIENSFDEAINDSFSEHSPECFKLISEKNWNNIKPVFKQYKNRR